MTSRGPVEVPWARVYFPFVDGSLAYDCAACGATCCKGFGCAMTPEDARVHQRANPASAAFVERASGRGLPVLKNLPPGCFFLRPNNLCGIHLEHGFASKPETCRLFPFNNFLFVGEWLVAAPHWRLCPLEVVANGSSPLSSHADLLAGMSLKGIGLEVADCITPDVDGSRLLELEIAVVEASRQHLRDGCDFHAFVAEQERLARALVGDSLHQGRSPCDVAALLRRSEDLFGCSRGALTEGGEEVARTVIALTGVLRAHLVFRKVGATAATSVHLSDVPRMITGAFITAQLARVAGMSRVTFQTVSRLFIEHQSLVALCGHLNDVVQWRRGELLSLVAPQLTSGELHAYWHLRRALLPRRQGKTPRPLGDLLIEVRDTAGQSDVVRALGNVLHERYSPIPEAPRAPRAPAGRRAKAALQNLVLDMLPNSTMDLLVRARSGR